MNTASIMSTIKMDLKANDLRILKGYVSKDHVHIFVSVPPQISVLLNSILNSLKPPLHNQLPFQRPCDTILPLF
ncbi:MAG: hypothetical protein SCARUB_04301 [Candidatus Scalindua rubra]|uniref:Transposase IS200-like domain-containing protein n=1 Tax=Candidatus Scalindua rubra TaxID=1872076 RepID=A0A1E3X4L2_9BACT|nr:MAG: hypothetical protein SCARUB_04301 [Candidatus Scalindua rubra]